MLPKLLAAQNSASNIVTACNTALRIIDGKGRDLSWDHLPAFFLSDLPLVRVAAQLKFADANAGFNKTQLIKIRAKAEHIRDELKNRIAEEVSHDSFDLDAGDLSAELLSQTEDIETELTTLQLLLEQAK